MMKLDACKGGRGVRDLLTERRVLLNETNDTAKRILTLSLMGMYFNIGDR